MKTISFIIGMLALGLGCNPQAQSTENRENVDGDETIEIPEDFQAFYDAFHSDTAYQIDHIAFPLSGLPANADTLSEPEGWKWQREDWKWHKPIDPTLTGYERRWEIIGSDLVDETIIQQASGYGLRRRFGKMDGGWMLIYYAGMNQM